MTIHDEFIFGQRSKANAPRTEEANVSKIAAAPTRVAQADKFCNFCEDEIEDGSLYIDGGRNLKMHVECRGEYLSNGK